MDFHQRTHTCCPSGDDTQIAEPWHPLRAPPHPTPLPPAETGDWSWSSSHVTPNHQPLNSEEEQVAGPAHPDGANRRCRGRSRGVQRSFHARSHAPARDPLLSRVNANNTTHCAGEQPSPFAPCAPRPLPGVQPHSPPPPKRPCPPAPRAAPHPTHSRATRPGPGLGRSLSPAGAGEGLPTWCGQRRSTRRGLDSDTGQRLTKSHDLPSVACVPLGAGSELDSGSGTRCHPAHVPPMSGPTFNP